MHLDEGKRPAEELNHERRVMERMNVISSGALNLQSSIEIRPGNKTKLQISFF